MAVHYSVKVFRDHRDRVKTAIVSSISSVAGKSFAAGLIDEDTQRDITDLATGRTARQHTVAFLNVVEDQIKLDKEPALIKFIGVLKDSDAQFYKTIIDELETALATEKALEELEVPSKPPQPAPVQDKAKN